MNDFNFLIIRNTTSDNKLIGKGGFGNVMKSSYNSFPIAIKILNDSFEKENYLKCIRELTLLKCLSNKYIPRVYGFSPPNKIIFEMIEGMTLKDFIVNDQTISDNKKSNQYCDLLKMKIILDLLFTLMYIHGSNTIHRDLKPNNILVDNNFNAIIIDFGISKVSEYTAETNNPRAGTTIYLSPEHCLFRSKSNNNNKNDDFELANVYISKKMDIWAIGLIINELFSGQSPYKNLDIWNEHQVILILSKEFEYEPESIIKNRYIKQIIRQCTQYWKEKRYSSIDSFCHMLMIFYIEIKNKGIENIVNMRISSKCKYNILKSLLTYLRILKWNIQDIIKTIHKVNHIEYITNTNIKLNIEYIKNLSNQMNERKEKQEYKTNVLCNENTKQKYLFLLFNQNIILEYSSKDIYNSLFYLYSEELHQNNSLKHYIPDVNKENTYISCYGKGDKIRLNQKKDICENGSIESRLNERRRISITELNSSSIRLYPLHLFKPYLDNVYIVILSNYVKDNIIYSLKYNKSDNEEEEEVIHSKSILYLNEKNQDYIDKSLFLYRKNEKNENTYNTYYICIFNNKEMKISIINLFEKNEILGEIPFYQMTDNYDKPISYSVYPIVEEESKDEERNFTTSNFYICKYNNHRNKVKYLIVVIGFKDKFHILKINFENMKVENSFEKKGKINSYDILTSHTYRLNKNTSIEKEKKNEDSLYLSVIFENNKSLLFCVELDFNKNSIVFNKNFDRTIKYMCFLSINRIVLLLDKQINKKDSKFSLIIYDYKNKKIVSSCSVNEIHENRIILLTPIICQNSSKLLIIQESQYKIVVYDCNKLRILRDIVFEEEILLFRINEYTNISHKTYISYTTNLSIKKENFHDNGKGDMEYYEIVFLMKKINEDNINNDCINYQGNNLYNKEEFIENEKSYIIKKYILGFS